MRANLPAAERRLDQLLARQARLEGERDGHHEVRTPAKTSRTRVDAAEEVTMAGERRKPASGSMPVFVKLVSGTRAKRSRSTVRPASSSPHMEQRPKGKRSDSGVSAIAPLPEWTQRAAAHCHTHSENTPVSRTTFGQGPLARRMRCDRVALRFVAWRKDASADKAVYR